MEKTVSIELVYSREDNDPLPLSEGAGWIDTFVHFFDLMYHQLSGDTLHFNYCDPGSLKSLRQGARENLRLVIAGKHLMNKDDGQWMAPGDTGNAENSPLQIVVLKSYFPKIDALRLQVHTMVYEFFKANGEEYLNFYDKLDNGNLMRNLGDIVYELYSLVQKKAKAPDVGQAARPKVFITESPDLQSEKNNLTRELEHLGYEVVSPVLASVEKEKLRDMCSDHSIFIHLIGKQLSIDETTSRTVFEVLIDEQIRRLKQGKSNHSKKRTGVYTWLCPEIANLKRSRWNGHRAVLSKIEAANEIELLTGSFEDFKTFLGGKLLTDSGSEDPDRIHLPEDTHPRSIYFIHDIKDLQDAAPYISFLRESGYIVYNPVFDKDILTTRQLHDECLKRFDIVMIMALNVTTPWVNVKMVDILKSHGMGRSRPVLGKLLITDREMELNVLGHARQFEFLAHRGVKENLSNLSIYLNGLANQ